MGFRFRRSFKIAPGVRVNLSKSGLSTSLGRRGASLNLGRRGARGTFGIPGTGISYLTGAIGGRRRRGARGGAGCCGCALPVVGALMAIAVVSSTRLARAAYQGRSSRRR